MRTSKDSKVAVKIIEIPYIHPKLKIGDLQANGKLFSDEQIALITNNAYIQKSQGRITKKELNEIFKNEIGNNPDKKFRFSLQKDGNDYSAIYKGKQSALGAGAFGSVKLLQDLKTGNTKQVLKVIKESSKKVVDEEKRGLKIARQFKSVQKRKPLKPQFEFVMDLARGRTLDKFKNGKLPIVTWIDMIINVLKEVKHLHDNNMLHRDIKPANILFDPITKKATIVDFGVATFNSSEADNYRIKLGIPTSITKDIIVKGVKEKIIKGTLKYMSPDALVGKASEKSEIYALGITFAEILNLTEKGTKYFPLKKQDITFNDVKKVDDINAKNTITDTTTRVAILKMLQDMVRNNGDLTLTSNSRGGSINIIEYFKKLREEFIDTLGLTHQVAYLNITDYLAANTNTRKEMVKKLSKSDEVWLIDNNEANKGHYLTLYAELASENLNVNYSVLQSDENNLDQAMRDYAHQREIQDRNIYDCSYTTKTGQLASLSASLNDGQVNKIISSLKNEAERFLKKYGSGNHPMLSISNTISTIQNIHNNKPITLTRAMKALDTLQDTLISEQESQNNIKKLMHDLEVATHHQSQVDNSAKGFDAVLRRKDPDFAGSMPSPLEESVIVNEDDEVSDPLTNWKNAIPLMGEIIGDNQALQFTVENVPKPLFESYWDYTKYLIPKNINNFEEFKAFNDKLTPVYQEKLIGVYSNNARITDMNFLNYILDKSPKLNWEKLLRSFELKVIMKFNNKFQMTEQGFNAFLNKLKTANLFESTLPIILKLVKGQPLYFSILFDNFPEKQALVLEKIKSNPSQFFRSENELIAFTKESTITKTQLNSLIELIKSPADDKRKIEIPEDVQRKLEVPADVESKVEVSADEKRRKELDNIVNSLDKRIEELPIIYRTLGGKGNHEKRLNAIVTANKGIDKKDPLQKLHQQIILLEEELMNAINSQGGLTLFRKKLTVMDLVKKLNKEVISSSGVKDLHHHYNRLLVLTVGEIYRNDLPSLTDKLLTDKQASIRVELLACTNIIKPLQYKYGMLATMQDNDFKNTSLKTPGNTR